MPATDTNIYYKADLAATAVSVAARSTKMFNIQLTNVASNAITYLQVFDALVADVTVGTTAPKFTIPLDAAAAAHVTTLAINYGDNGMTFKTGLVIAATTSATGSSAPSGNVLVTIAYL